MAETLRPCPFCGGEAMEFTGEDAAPHRWTVECAVCGAHVGSDTRHKARAKWNRRAKWTCRMVRASGVDEKRGDKRAWPVCSECGGEMRSNDKFCPNCGARVVEE